MTKTNILKFIHRSMAAFVLFFAVSGFASSPCSLLLLRVLRGEIANPWFQASEVGPGLFLLEFKNTHVLASSLMRFQEFYESPKFRGKIFSRKEFRQWHVLRNQEPRFSYLEVDGFNFPGSIFKPFVEGRFDPLTAPEFALTAWYAQAVKRSTNFYVIGVVRGGDPETLKHEIAHALYYLDPEYRRGVDALLARVDLGPVKKVLAEMGDYHHDVLHDEAHAWLLFHTEYLGSAGLDLSPYRKLRKRLEQNYYHFGSKFFNSGNR